MQFSNSAVGSDDGEPAAHFIIAMETIKLYQYNGDIRTINKTLPVPVELQGQIRNSFDLLTPVVSLKYEDGLKFNYCFIPIFGRYYFIENITATGGDRYELSLSVDVLKTYENEIFAATATVLESSTPNNFISNRNDIFIRTPNFEQLEFPNKNLFNKEGSIIMVTIKGKKS